ncbi:MAG: hypothetical protein QM680_04755 [Luteolibacter sp.]
MVPEAPTRRKRRGCAWWLKLAAIFPLLLLILFGLSNLALTSPWARAWISGKIRAKSGLDAEISGLSWSPWNGVTCYQLRILQPAPLRAELKPPLLEVKRATLLPEWKSLRHRALILRSLTLDSPKILLPLEIFGTPAGPEAPKQESLPPEIAAVPQAPPPPSPTAESTPRRPDITIRDLVPGMADETAPAKPLGIPTAWLHLKNASFTLLLASRNKPLIEVSNLNGNLPLAGDPAVSTLSYSTFKTCGTPVTIAQPLRISWKPPILELEKQNLTVADQTATFEAKIALRPYLPMQWELQFSTQPLRLKPLPFHNEIQASQAAFQGRFLGALLVPASWRGDFLTSLQGVRTRIAGHELVFPHGHALAFLRGKVLSCLDAAMVSDELALMGNATLVTDGRAAGVLRFVAAPETLQSVTQHLFPKIPANFTPLSTPQRAAFDLHAFGSIREIFLQIGHQGPVLKLQSSPQP